MTRLSRPRLQAPAPGAVGAAVAASFADLRRELGVPESFPPEVVAAAEHAAPRPDLGYDDATDLELITIDPPGSRDLDQAMHLSRTKAGYLVHYAIADVGAFVEPDGPLDREAHARGETLYSPDTRTPLYPPALSEGAASLLEGAVRPSVLWRLELDAAGELSRTDVRRAHVRSRARLDYAGVQATLDASTDRDGVLPLLREIGQLRIAREAERGGVSLAVPEQEVDGDATNGWRLAYRAPLPAEDWNAQISLLTGMAAARLMLQGRIGLLRTLPPPDERAVASLRRSALAIGVAWPEGVRYADAVRRLEPTVPAEAAVLELATVLLRGAGYVAFDGDLPPQPIHSAVAAPYAHATAPLRRLADRYVSETCLALCAGREVPAWVRAALPALPETMAAADHRAHQLENAMVDLMEATLVAGRVGECFRAVVVEANAHAGVVQLRDPAVRARCVGADLPLGAEIDVRLVTADPAKRTIEFARV